jgi:uncharacterized membrane protein YczE
MVSPDTFSTVQPPLMRTLPSFFRFIAIFLMLTIVSSGMAMASYVCPQLSAVSNERMMVGMPCAGMDKEKPVHCAQSHSSAQLALEHLAETPVFVPATVFTVLPVQPIVADVVPVPVGADIPPDQGADPPYLRTQRLRI